MAWAPFVSPAAQGAGRDHCGGGERDRPDYRRCFLRPSPANHAVALGDAIGASAGRPWQGGHGRHRQYERHRTTDIQARNTPPEAGREHPVSRQSAPPLPGAARLPDARTASSSVSYAPAGGRRSRGSARSGHQELGAPEHRVLFDLQRGLAAGFRQDVVPDGAPAGAGRGRPSPGRMCFSQTPWQEQTETGRLRETDRSHRDRYFSCPGARRRCVSTPRVRSRRNLSNPGQRPAGSNCHGRTPPVPASRPRSASAWRHASCPPAPPRAMPACLSAAFRACWTGM